MSRLGNDRATSSLRNGIEAPPMKHASLALRILADLTLVGALAVMAWWMGTTFAGRVGYPFDLEWMEGGMLLHAVRVRDGLPLYVAPSPEFIPYIYPPGYAWFVGMLGRVFELGYPLARWVSMLGIALSALLLVIGVRQEGHRWSLGLGAAALFLSCYDEVGAFFDLVRTDGQQVFLMGAAVLLCRRVTKPALAAGGLVLWLAFTTKHNMAMLGLPIAIALWRVHGWRMAAWFAAWSAGPALAWTGWMQLSSDGYFLTYLLAVPATHPMVGTRMFPQAEIELMSAFPWPLALASLPIWLGLGARILRRIRKLPAHTAPAPAPDARYARWYWIGVVSMGVVMVVLMRGHHGGFQNVLMPGFWLIALVTGFGLGAVAERWRHPLLSSAMLLLAAGLVGFQSWDGRWKIDRYLPTDADLEVGQQLLEQIEAFDGPVLMPHSPYYPVMVGKPPSFALIALWDITHDHSPLKKEARAIDRAIQEQRFAAVISANKKLKYGVPKHYERTTTIKHDGRSLYPKTGWRVRPRYIYEPKVLEDEVEVEAAPENTDP
jgi:hypothetical protein